MFLLNLLRDKIFLMEAKNEVETSRNCCFTDYARNINQISSSKLTRDIYQYL